MFVSTGSEVLIDAIPPYSCTLVSLEQEHETPLKYPLFRIYF